MIENESTENTHRYYVTFRVNKNYECYGDSVEVLTERSALAFAWGVIRSFLESKDLPLDGYATDICVIDSATMECVGRYGVIPIPSSVETMNQKNM